MTGTAAREMLASSAEDHQHKSLRNIVIITLGVLLEEEDDGDVSIPYSKGIVLRCTLRLVSRSTGGRREREGEISF